MDRSGEKNPPFGANLRAARLRAGLSQQKLADQADIDRATVSLIENDRESPRADTVLRLAEVLEVSPAELWSAGVAEGVGEAEIERELRYEPLEVARLHRGLEELLTDDRTRLMLNLTDEEERMLRSIRTRREAPLGKEFFLDVLIAYRRHHS